VPAFRQRSLFQKYFIALLIAVAAPLLTNGVVDAWFSYRDQRNMLNALMRKEATAAADKIHSFLDGMRVQLGWMAQQAWTAGAEEQHRLDALRVLRLAPAIVDITLVDGAGQERVNVSRLAINRAPIGESRAEDPAIVGAQANGVWYGPVTYNNGSEPFMVMSVAGNRKAAGEVIANINLKLIWDVVSAIHVGRDGQAFVIDQPGRLIAHPDISKVLRGTDDQAAQVWRNLRDAIAQTGGAAITTRNPDSRPVIATTASVPQVGWTIVVEQPQSEAFAPIYAALWRTSGLLLAATLLAAALAYLLARRMSGPIHLLEEGAEKIGAGQFGHRIEIRTGDEIERLATRFNAMAGELTASQERAERMARLKRYLAPQVAELVEMSGDDSVLAGQRAEVVTAFCDLRGFTAFSARAEPEEIMRVLHDYYQALGAIVSRFEATLTSFSADGLMVLVNAPVQRAEPALRAVEMAVAMQDAVQRLISGWRSQGYAIGFGVGLAMGWATVGRIGYEGRHDYTAIGNVVNLASRLCSSAEDQQILIDAAIAQAVRAEYPLVALGARHLKGYDADVAVFEIVRTTDPHDPIALANAARN